MTSADFRVESNHPIAGRLLPVSGSQQYFFSDRALAVAMAAKSVTKPSGQEIRVVHVPTGEVVFRKAASPRRVQRRGRERSRRLSAGGDRSVRLSRITGSKPTSTSASDGSAASPSRSSRASW